MRNGDSASRAWDIDEILWDSHGNLDVQGPLPTDRPHVVKLYGSYTFKWGTRGWRQLLRRQRNTSQYIRVDRSTGFRFLSTVAETWAEPLSLPRRISSRA